jgi:hypothetical protein
MVALDELTEEELMASADEGWEHPWEWDQNGAAYREHQQRRGSSRVDTALDALLVSSIEGDTDDEEEELDG